MQVKDAIKYLQRINPEDEIVIAWWVMEDFFDKQGFDTGWCKMDVTKEEWESVVHIGDNMDWSMTHESLQEVMEMEIESNRKGITNG
tara:strand:- start:72 stop:332 length:261 start_codon:yes stop_codon:yes gene_type:complete